jgi:uncharacterized protein with HEPN domain
LSYDDFRGDDLFFYAVVHCLEIISEASRRLPDEIKNRHPEIPWNEMAAAGNVYRHEYEDVAQQRVWATFQFRLPTLLAALSMSCATLGNYPERLVRPYLFLNAAARFSANARMPSF